MDYKEQIEQAKHAAEKWREKHRIVGVGELRVDCMVDDITRSITDLLARAEAAEARAEKAERERDAAVDLIGWIYYEAYVSVEYDVRQHLDWLKDKIEQWRKKKGK